jgi:ABC-type uncharacterized transport system substrate-binding protein/HAMP domain-containing protein
MYKIGVVAYTEHGLNEVTTLEMELNRVNYPVHIEQMLGKPTPTQLEDFYYEENAILLWLCRCHADATRCREAIECFVDAHVDVIITLSPEAFIQAIRLVGQYGIPIIFTHLSKSQYRDYISTVGKPLGTITGIYDIWEEIAEERLTLLTEVVPPPNTVHTLFNPQNTYCLIELENLRKAAKAINLTLVEYPACTIDEAKQVLENLPAQSDHAIFRLSDPMFDPLTGLMGAIAHEHYIPYMGKIFDELERCGSLFALEPEDISRQVARLVDLILKGLYTSSIPPVEPIAKMLSVNLQVAQNLGVIISPAVLKRAQIVLPTKERRPLGLRLWTILVPSIFLISIAAVAASYLGVLSLFGITFFTMVGLAITLWLYMYRKIIQPLKKLTFAAEKMGSGDVNTPILELKVEDEISALARALRRMKSNLSRSYADLEQLTKDLEIRVDELTEANLALRQAQHDLEIAGKRIIEADDSSRFALTTFIHDEILGPLDELSAVSQELEDPQVIRLARDLDTRMRRLRFDLSVPILQDLCLEIRRLIQETLPMIYPEARSIQMELDLEPLEHVAEIEPACVFLLYRFVRGAVSNVYRHAKADKIRVYASCTKDTLTICVMDDGQGFDLGKIDQFLTDGHYFFHDIQIRARQLNGEFTVATHPGAGTVMQVSIPV